MHLLTPMVSNVTLANFTKHSVSYVFMGGIRAFGMRLKA